MKPTLAFFSLALASMAGASPALASSNLVVNGDFSAGNSGFSSGYAYESIIDAETQYTVTAASNINIANVYHDWTAVNTDPDGGNGNVLLANGAIASNIPVWSQTVSVAAHKTYVFSFCAADVNYIRTSDAVLSPSINNVSGANFSTNGSWLYDFFVWNSGTSTSAALTLIDVNTAAAFNDFAIDDIRLAAAVPEPSTWAMLLLAFAGLGLAAYRRRQKQ